MTDTQDRKRGPSLWWFAVAAVIFVLGLVPFGWVLVNTIQGIADYDLHEFESSTQTTLTIEDEQIAIWASFNAPGFVDCSGSKDDGSPGNGNDEPLDDPAASMSFTVGSQTWERIAVTPEEWKNGEYTVTCTATSSNGGAVDPELRYADNPSVLSTFIGFVIAVGIAGLATITAIVIAIVVGVKRSRANKPKLPQYPQFPQQPPPPPAG